MSLSPRDQVLRDMLNVTDIDLGQAVAILDWLDSIGYQGGEPDEPGYAEAGTLAVSTSMAMFFNGLVSQGVPPEYATAIAIAFMTNATKDK